MRKIIFLVLLLLTVLTIAKDTRADQLYLTFKPIAKTYTINYDTLIGSKTRVRATQQNPYSFCFSTAAAMLWDQQRCMLNNKNCQTFTQTSFLAATPAGQDLPTDIAIEVEQGGSPLRSLQHLVNVGYTTLDRCNYSHIKDLEQQYAHKDLKFAKENWQKHESYAPYLERYWRREFRQKALLLNPNLSSTALTKLLHAPLTQPELMNKILLNDACYKNLKQDKRFVVRAKRLGSKPQESAQTIENLLRTGKPVIINMCLASSYTGCEQAEKHSLIVVASAKATHLATGDQRTVYWLVNSWGEEWQEKNSDGWVFADDFLMGLTGDFIWLDQK
jgi:hypothetical protein